MSQYVEFFLLGLLIVIINSVPEFMCSAVNNKVMLLLLILLNIYLNASSKFKSSNPCFIHFSRAELLEARRAS